MNRLLFLLSFSLSFFTGSEFLCQINNVIVEPVFVHDDAVEFGPGEGFTTYRIHLVLEGSNDYISSIAGDSNDFLSISTTGTFWQSTAVNHFGNTSNESQFDSWITIDSSPEDPGPQPLTIGMSAALEAFQNGNDLILNDEFGGSWFTTFPCGSSNCDYSQSGFAGDDNRVLIGQFTTDGVLSGTLNVLLFPQGNQENSMYDKGLEFSSSSPQILGCTDLSACNYVPSATVSDGACEYESCATPNELAWTVEDVHTEGELAGACTYRVYAISDSNVSLAGGDSDRPLTLSGTSEIYNNPFVSGPTLNSINQGVLDMAPLAEFDSWVTLGIEVNESECSISTVNSPNQPWQSFFTSNTSTTSIIINDEYGGGWYSTSDCNNGESSTPGQVLLVQVTTWGDLEGEIPFATIEGEESVWHTGSFNIKPGCLDELAINFRADATHDNATCIYGEAGCMDILACNFLNTAVVDDGSCEYANLGYDCFDVCLSDSDSDGVCDDYEIFGCTEPTASNYNDEATEEDSTCIIFGCLYSSADNFNAIANADDNSCVFSGCLDDTAINFSLLANTEDNTCLYLGCMDSIALNFNPSANLAGTCEYCEGDVNFDGEIQLEDLLDLLSNYGQSCD